MKKILRADIKLGPKLSVLRKIRFHHTGLKSAKKKTQTFSLAFQIENIREKSFLIIWKRVIRNAIFFSSLNKDKIFLHAESGWVFRIYQPIESLASLRLVMGLI